MNKRPNILFLMSDQHRFDFTGYEGHLTRTPTLDWLAATGARFCNAYTPSPVCVPARQCLAAGQLPRTCRCERFTDDLAPGYQTFARVFSRHAYQTTCAGKLHHHAPDQMQGWNWRLGEEFHVHPNFLQDKVTSEFERYRTAPDPDSMLVDSLRRSGLGFNPVEAADDYTEQGAHHALRLLFANSLKPASQRPHLFMVSTIGPHDPFLTGDETAFHYYRERVRLPEVLPVLPEWRCAGDWPEMLERGRDLEECTVLDAHAAYHAMIEHVDSLFGRVLSHLRAIGQDLDDWIIVYCSDHGELLGDYHHWWKFNFFEASVRVPLLIRAPRFFNGGIQIPQNVNLCDLFATLCEMAGLPVPGGLDSRSLLPLLRGDATGWDNESISQIKGKLMVKRDDCKYIYHGSNDVEILFDLARDPRETRNAIADPSKVELVAAFRARRAALGFGPDADPQYRNAGYST